MLKILLIDANGSWLVRNRGPADLEQIIPPIGLMYIASYLRHALCGKVDVKIINIIAECASREDLNAAVRSYNPDIAGIRGLNIYKTVFHETAAAVKEFRRDILVVGGGPYATMDFEHAIRDVNIDYCVIGEGELTFAEMIERLLAKEDIRSIRGIAYLKNGAPVQNPPRPFIGDLDTLPFPDYSLIPADAYGRFVSYGYNRRKQAVIFSSRGCPYECVFCHTIFGKKYRARSAQNIFAEIRTLYENYGINDFYFVDDNFNLDYKRAMDLFDLIINWGVKINLYLANGIRGDIADRPFIDRMAEAGVIWVTFSAETASERLQREIKKFIDLKKLALNIHYACSKNLMVNCCVMVGFPTETKEEAVETIEWLKQFKKIIVPMFFSVKYYPGTPICGMALQEGIHIDLMQDAYAETYHDIRHSATPLIPHGSFTEIYLKFLNEVFMSKERLINALAIQDRYLSHKEILDVYSIFFRKRIKDIELDVLRYAK